MNRTRRNPQLGCSRSVSYACQKQPVSGTDLRTMVLHASATVAQTHMDRLDNCMAAALLAALRPAEFSIFLRHRKHPYRCGFVAGKPADIFMAGLRIAGVSNALHRRSRDHRCHGSSRHGRNRIHVRPECSVADSPAQPISYSDATAVAVGDTALRLRPPRLEISDAHHLDRGADQLLLAPRARRELGPRPILPRTACRAGRGLLAGVPVGATFGRVFPDTPAVVVVDSPPELPLLAAAKKLGPLMLL